MSLFNQRKNKSYNYRPRFQDSKTEDGKAEFEAKWNDVKPESNRKGSVLLSLPGLLIMLVAIGVLVYVLNGYVK